MELVNKPKWLKGRGYLHITPKINVNNRADEIVSKVQNPLFVARHAFFPLIHAVIKERKFKKHPENSLIRAHSHFYKGEFKKTAKNRPLHYATHIDSLIFGYYAEVILNLYEQRLKNHAGLSDCVIAYRKIAVDEEEPETGKSTINFAFETFEQIAAKAENECAVLMFDIKSFFSELDHILLKKNWCKLLDVRMLPKDHYNVYNATTNFSYILRDELRLQGRDKGRKKGFDERKLAEIRKIYGEECFFESVAEFRKAIQSKTIKVYKKPFVKNGVPVGIPQGLPISAVLANLYLYHFDLAILDKVVNQLGGFYRRYSDDILIICTQDQIAQIETIVKEEIVKSKVSISEEKTETYLFRRARVGANKSRIVSIQILKDRCNVGKPLTYLGFEFYGEKILIKSGNLAKFYRRMIYSVKRKANRAIKIANDQGENINPIVFRGRLKRLYSKLKLTNEKQFNTKKRLVRTSSGTYDYRFVDIENKYNTNYFSYVNRASDLMKEESIKTQLRKHKAIFNAAIAKHLWKHI